MVCIVEGLYFLHVFLVSTHTHARFKTHTTFYLGTHTRTYDDDTRLGALENRFIENNSIHCALYSPCDEALHLQTKIDSSKLYSIYAPIHSCAVLLSFFFLSPFIRFIALFRLQLRNIDRKKKYIKACNLSFCLHV